MVWAGWLYSQEWWRQELWRTQLARPAPPSIRRGRRSESASAPTRTTTSCRRAPGSVTTSAPRRGSTADVEKALRSIKARVLYMPSETDLYFPDHRRALRAGADSAT